MWRGGLGLAYLLPALSFAGASLSKPCSVSTSRSSNWTGAVNASSSRRKHHDFAHEKLRVRSVSRTKPNLSCRMASEYFRVVSLASLCLAHNHRWLCSIRRRTAIRPSGTPCRTAHRSESRAISSLRRVTLHVTSEHFPGLLGSSPIPSSLSRLALISN